MSDSIRCKADDYGFYSYLKGTLHSQDAETAGAITPDSRPLSQYPYTYVDESYVSKKNGTKSRYR